jgi:hypothetical protein
MEPDDRESGSWVAAMRAGNFAKAWKIGDRDLAFIASAGPPKHSGPRHLQRIWRGEPLRRRRVLVRCYHGLGDTTQFARFLSPLRAIASEVILWCQPALVSLMATVDGVDRVLPLHDGVPDVGFDVDIEIMEIPHAIRASRAQIETRGPYLGRTSGLCRNSRASREPISAGLVWDVGDWDRRRVIPPHLLRQLSQPGVRLYSLQRGGSAAAAAGIGARDISVPEIDLLAQRLGSLDLCICPDTMVAHLSAALGRETWIMLHAECDWRWPASGASTFWYPTVRLFRQQVAGDWRDVVSDVSAALAEKARLVAFQPRASSDCARDGEVPLSDR